MFKHILSVISFCLSASFGFSQSIPTYDYHPPLKIPLVLSANFGELRPNHFHMGVDFKTNGKIGYNLYSIDDGYVSRVKVSTHGYGKVVYIDHPNGITSVYAHCSEFKGKIDSLVKAAQKEEQNFEIEVYPPKDKIKVSRGQIIAISGNSGGSTAPHLHFELRDTKTEHALNPLVYGFDIADSRSPEIRGVKVYGVSEEGYCFQDKEIRKTAVKSGNSYTIPGNEIVVPAHFLSEKGGLGLAFDVIDRLDAAPNPCGLYASQLRVGNDTLFGQQTDRIPFESTRYINTHKDYKEYTQFRRKFHKSFRTNENDLPIYTNGSNGVIKAKPGSVEQIHYFARDPKGNRSSISFQLRVTEGSINPATSIAVDHTYLTPSTSMKVSHENTDIEFGIGTVYEPIQIEREKIGYSIGDPEVPVHRAYRILIEHRGVEDEKKYIEFTTAKGKKRALMVRYENGKMICESTYFGTYKVKRDTIPPRVVPVNFSLQTTQKSLKWKLNDDASGIADYDLYLDGEWFLIEYDYKSGLIEFHRPEGFKGKRKAVLTVTDQCGNMTTWEEMLDFL